MKYKLLCAVTATALLTNQASTFANTDLYTNLVQSNYQISTTSDKNTDVTELSDQVSSHTYYVSTKNSQNSASGDGTESNPFNLMSTALAKVKDGDTIVISGEGFLNDVQSSGGAPLIVDKNITIKGKSNDKNTNDTFRTRLSGIILNANLTLENINLQFDNPVRDHIFVNGYTLTLKNVGLNSLSREIDIFAGEALELGGKSKTPGVNLNMQNVESKKGDSSKIIIENDGVSLKKMGNLYLGSQNGPSDIPVEVSLTRKNNNDPMFKDIFLYGADQSEATSKPGNFIDTNEPTPPKQNTNFTTSDVTITFDGYAPNGNITLDGSYADNVHLKFTNQTNNTPVNIQNINTLEIEKGQNRNGKFVPASLSFKDNSSNIILNEDTELDLQDFKDNLTVDKVTINNQVGNIRLNGKDDNVLKINESIETKQNGKLNFLFGFGQSGSVTNTSKVYLKTPTSIDTSKITFVEPSNYKDEVVFTMDKSGDWTLKNKDANVSTPVKNYTSIEFDTEDINNIKTLVIDPDKTFQDDAQLVFVIEEAPDAYYDDEELNYSLYIDDTKIEEFNESNDWVYKGLEIGLGETDGQDKGMLIIRIPDINTLEKSYPESLKIALKIAPKNNSSSTELKAETVLKIEDRRVKDTSESVSSSDSSSSTTESSTQSTTQSTTASTTESTTESTTQSTTSKPSVEQPNKDSVSVEKIYTPSMYVSNKIYIDVNEGDIENINVFSDKEDINVLSIDSYNDKTVVVELDKTLNYKDSISLEINPSKARFFRSIDDDKLSLDNNLFDLNGLDITDEGEIILNNGDRFIPSNKTEAPTIVNDTLQVPSGGILKSVSENGVSLTIDLNNSSVNIKDNLKTESNAIIDKGTIKLSNGDTIVTDKEQTIYFQDTSFKLPEGGTIIKENNKSEDIKPNATINTTSGKVDKVDDNSNSSSSSSSSSSGAVVTVAENASSNNKVDTTVTNNMSDSSNMPVESLTSALSDTSSSNGALMDIDDHWAKDSIDLLVNRSLLKGTSSTTFSPETKMTRGMLVSLIYRLDGENVTDNINQFKDIKQNDYYYDAVLWAKTNNIILGMTENTFAPNNNITREQIATILYNYAKTKDLVNNEDMSDTSNIKDLNKVSSYAKESIQWALNNNILSGYEDNTLKPKNTATRAEVSTIFANFINKFNL